MRYTALFPVFDDLWLTPFGGVSLYEEALRRIGQREEVEEIVVRPAPDFEDACRAKARNAAASVRIEATAMPWGAASSDELSAVVSHLKERDTDALLYIPTTGSFFDDAAFDFLKKGWEGTPPILLAFAFPGIGPTLIHRGLLSQMEEVLAGRGAELYHPRWYVPEMNRSWEYVTTWPKRPLEFWTIRALVPMTTTHLATREVYRILVEDRKIPLRDLSAARVFEALENDSALLHLVPRSIWLEISTTNDAAPIHSPLRNGLSRTGRPEYMERRVWERVLKGVEKEYRGAVTLHLAGVGEPLRHPEFRRMLSELAEMNKRLPQKLEVNLETDLRMLDDEMVEAILEVPVYSVMAALDASSADAYRAVRPNADYEEVRKNLNRLIQAKRAAYLRDGCVPPLPLVAVTTTLIRELEGSVDELFDAFPPRDEFLAQARRTGAPAAPRAFYDAGHMVEYVVLRGPSTYAGQMPDLRLQSFTPLRRLPCRRLERTMFVLSDGAVVPCDRVFDASPEEVVGNVIEAESLQDLWRKLAPLRSAHDRGAFEDAMSLCAACEDWHIPVD